MGIHQIPVVSNGVGALAVVDDKWLGIVQNGASGGGIPDMADGAGAVQKLQAGFFKDIRNQPHSLVSDDLLVLDHGDARAFLTPVLKRIEPEVGQPGRIRMTVDAEQAAGFARLVFIGEIPQIQDKTYRS